MPRRLIILHGHFYQPPRENPWIEEVEVEDSAHPFHDWNARISAECYGPNGAARIKSPEGRITDIVNNYKHLSFNFGPTLLAWMERHAPEVYRSVVEADAQSVRRRGHGNAIAQGYNHAILPLCSPRDRQTQVRWGIADFRHRFEREPEGFWLPETAADCATLRTLVDEGVRFTILSPFQATRVKAPGGEWTDAVGARFDPTRPFRVDVGDGKSIVVFFYDGPIARSFAFGEGLAHGDELVRRIEGGLDGARGHDEVLTIAVDGETFGHHKKGGDEVLAAALRKIDARDDLELVNFAQVLDQIPVEWEAEIAEGSSWSCAHGIERWRSDCGCQANGQEGWTQHWRAPLREALDGLRDRLASLFESESASLLQDPWGARDRFVDVVLDPERAGAPAFLAREAGRALDADEEERAMKLLEMQRQAMLMYTSCGWFFSELSGLETVQILKYAARALQLAREVSGHDLESEFRDALERAPSNIQDPGNGKAIFDAYVKPSVVSLEGVAAHLAIAGLFQEPPVESGRIFCFKFHVPSRRRESNGPALLGVGQLVLESLITHERFAASFCVLHFGASDYRCGLRPFARSETPPLASPVVDDARQAALATRLFAQLERTSIAQVLRAIDEEFPGRDYTLRDLFIDERRQLARVLLDETMRRYERAYLDIYEDNRRLMEFLREISSPVPSALRVAADVGLTHELEELAAAVAARHVDADTALAQGERLATLAQSLGARIDRVALAGSFDDIVRTRVVALTRQGGGAAEAMELADVLSLAARLSLSLDLWAVQNLVWAWAASSRNTLDRRSLARLGRSLWIDESALQERAASAPGPTPALETLGSSVPQLG